MLILKSEQAKLYISVKLFMNVLSKLNGKKFTVSKNILLDSHHIGKIVAKTNRNSKNFVSEKALAIAECWGEFCSFFNMQNIMKKKN